MGWFDDPDRSELAVRHALRIAKGKELPVAARSCTRKEYLDRFRKRAIVLVGIYLLSGIVILIGPVLEGGKAGRMALAAAVPILGAGPLLIWLAIHWRMNRNDDYRDPGIAVDVGADGIIVRGAGGDYGMRWHEIEAHPIWVTIKHGVQFIGLWVQSPLGWVQLDEQHYRNGRIAAALIVTGMHDDFHERQKARIERIG